MNDSIELLKALHFAAIKHRDQRRKGQEAAPYINHPIEVAEMLARVGNITDLIVLQSAFLHDTIEDTQTSAEEIEQLFGSEVRAVVLEVTDDKNLPKDVRKRLQIEHAPHLSDRAKLVKIADRTGARRFFVLDMDLETLFNRQKQLNDVQPHHCLQGLF